MKKQGKKYSVGKKKPQKNEKTEEAVVNEPETLYAPSVERSTIRINQDGKVIAAIPIHSEEFYFLDDLVKDQRNMPDLYYRDIVHIINFLGFLQKDLADFLHIDASTITRWKKNENAIGVLRSKIVFDTDKIIKKGVRIFGSEQDFKEWLYLPNYALGDVRPLDMLKDPYGLEQLDGALESISWGGYF